MIKKAAQFLLKIILSLFFLIFFSDVSFAKNSNSDEFTVSINAENIKIYKAIEYIKEKYGWDVVLSDRLKSKNFSGKYIDEPLRTFFKKILNEKNIAILYDYKIKVIKVCAYGLSINNGNGDYANLSISEVDNKIHHKEDMHRSAITHPLTDLEIEEMNERRKYEQMLYEKWANNPASYDPITGMTLGKMESIKHSEQKAYEEWASNPNSIDPVTGMTLMEMETLRKFEQKTYEELKKINTN
ncbi:hypothetical protein JWG42_01760 [Desulfoprunum benzoelyticum]|uniref:Type II secretory pathway component GspD/PulD (Secretin) n=1 Tax=Desulfoprunum benzoelyticum TaxID=1506996 RepID=A0A840UTA2_9BACT|nr:hypothetical protein [Desulfoprunum benzoelyticum]MBB5346594.1 type II secretory pathway component GspD/PulD (secretin) [Desulfoprunum benzoelyticum]MBM9528877.1 hypothetical protein [Desulfoprunum benzoelyticum]